jgi:hypothetical protein
MKFEESGNIRFATTSRHAYRILKREFIEWNVAKHIFIYSGSIRLCTN